MPSRILAIFAVPAVLVLLVFVLLGVFVWWPFYILAIPMAALAVWWYWNRSEAAIISKLDARPLGQREGERVLNLVESLCLTSGIDQPDVMVIDTPAWNLLTLSGRNDVLVVTTGLLEGLDLMEMEGAVAHGLSKLSTGAVQYETLAASAKPLITGMQQELARRWGSGDAGVIQFDISGVGLTRYPPGLRSALERIDGRSTDIEGTDSLGAALLIPPAEERVPLDQRIAFLWEL